MCRSMLPKSDRNSPRQLVEDSVDSTAELDGHAAICPYNAATPAATDVV
jgi:hypothetical protein